MEFFVGVIVGVVLAFTLPLFIFWFACRIMGGGYTNR